MLHPVLLSVDASSVESQLVDSMAMSQGLAIGVLSVLAVLFIAALVLCIISTVMSIKLICKVSKMSKDGQLANADVMTAVSVASIICSILGLFVFMPLVIVGLILAIVGKIIFKNSTASE